MPGTRRATEPIRPIIGRPEHDVGPVRRPGGVEGLGGDQDVGPGGAAAARRVPACRSVVSGGRWACAPAERARGQRAAAGERGRLRPVGEGLGPVGAVGREVRRGAVPGILCDQVGEPPKARGPGSSPRASAEYTSAVRRTRSEYPKPSMTMWWMRWYHSQRFSPMRNSACRKSGPAARSTGRARSPRIQLRRRFPGVVRGAQVGHGQRRVRGSPGRADAGRPGCPRSAPAGHRPRRSPGAGRGRTGPGRAARRSPGTPRCSGRG